MKCPDNPMTVFIKAIFLMLMLGAFTATPAKPDTCSDCHKNVSPNIVVDWQRSKHGNNGVGCVVCHGPHHKSKQDSAKAKMPTPETCKMCHVKQVEQFSRGKHAFAWAAMKAMPTFHWQPMAQIDGMKGCGGCHKVGLKTEEEITALKEQGAGFDSTEGHASIRIGTGWGRGPSCAWPRRRCPSGRVGTRGHPSYIMSQGAGVQV